MALFAARAASVWMSLALVAGGASGAAAQVRPALAAPMADPGPEGDSAPNSTEPARPEASPGPPPPAPIRRADDTVVVCSLLLRGQAAARTGGAALDPGIARISGDGGAVSVVWSGVRIEGEAGQKRASCRAEDQQVVSVVLDGEELLDGPQPY